MVDRLGIHGAALQLAASAQASQTAASAIVATKATSNILDTWTVGDRRYLALANFVPLGTAATGAATVAIYHGTATGSMSAASVGTGTTAMQMTGNIGSAGGIMALELQGSDLVGKNRYLQAIVTPGGSLVAAIALDLITEARFNSPTVNNLGTGTLLTPVVVSDLS
jgi:hypothetical protein